MHQERILKFMQAECKMFKMYKMCKTREVDSLVLAKSQKDALVFHIQKHLE